MDHAQALQYLKDARPIFELAEQPGLGLLEDKLEYGQFSLLTHLGEVWQTGWSGPEIEDLCRQAGYSSWQIKAVSLYFWNSAIGQHREQKETVSGWITAIFWVITSIGILIVGIMLSVALNLNNSGRYNTTGQIYAIIGLVICSPILALGYVFKEVIMKFMERSFSSQQKQTWPKGLYPDNEEGRRDLDK